MFTNELSNTEKMPVLFVGHGSPMNAIEENEFVTNLDIPVMLTPLLRSY